MEVAASVRAERAWEVLAASGARRTLARVLVVEILAGAAGHLSVNAIHERVAAVRPEVNVSTVHRTVGFLAEHGVVHLLQWPGEALYGLNERPHVHAVCDRCGRHSEIQAGELASVVAEAQRCIDLDLGGTGLALFGRCRHCVGRDG